MTRRAILLGVVLLVAATAGSAVIGATAAAQETGTETTTANGSAENSVVAQVDSTVVVTSYRYNASSETFFVTLRNDGDDDKSVTITEIINRDSKGSRKFGISVVEVEPDETVTAEVSASRVDGAAGVMVLTTEAIETGAGVYLQESKQTDHRLIRGEASGAHVRAGIAFSGVGTIVLVLLGAWQYVATANSEEVEPTLDPHITLFGRIWRWRR